MSNTQTRDRFMCQNCGETATTREVFGTIDRDCGAHTFGQHEWAERDGWEG